MEHLTGANNFFSDLLSRHPVGLEKGSRGLVSKHRRLLVAKTDFGVDKTLLKELGNLSHHQLSDPTLTKICEQLEKNPRVYKGKYMIQTNTEK
jgi:hypothetical protein